ncbi:M48 family metallopeptidase [Aureibaculum sp. 2210JD6-5]|uniref:M48 family metallopeptidase n=1 Tax=Aureibaculum sp. 2210JD6-5 TaxID=3103957 RepID=UPI002AAE56C5|nr:M48 family metallopeptidase [Aureibaculum sp. 2210JD6-5]MDY7394244.1 M48 family metallopeptidase [Aureibaculum sp. 2210JD6-5]
MTAQTVFYIIIGILTLNFVIDKYLDYLNAKHFDDEIPPLLDDVYDKKEYEKSQAYKKENFKFSSLTGAFSFVLTIAFFFFEGFAYVDQWARSISDNQIVITLVFFGIIMFGSDILTTPLSYYKTFVIEEKYGFNKTTKKLFFIDKIKGWFLMIIIGGGILALIVWFYQQTGKNFWIYTWAFMAVFSIFMTLFYSTLIVPLFNKQSPLEEGELKTALENFAQKVGFNLDKIFVIDGSKRSTKANAYFTGFGKKKRIVLYDTLINDLETDEIVAVLAHEVGHYKKKHVVFNMVSSILLTGLTLYILSFFIDSKLLANALSVSEPSFHIGLIAFGVLYSPISEITGLIMNIFSRKFEYQADDYAKSHFGAKPLTAALKKLSKNSLSNLTPHKAYVFMHYSHPTLLQRVKAML